MGQRTVKSATKKRRLEWYGVKGLFRWYFKENGETSCVEERVVIFKAADFDHAIEQAEKEADIYCIEDPTANFRIEPLGWWNAYWIGEEKLASGVECFSRLADTKLPGSSFIKRYYPKCQDHEA